MRRSCCLIRMEGDEVGLNEVGLGHASLMPSFNTSQSIRAPRTNATTDMFSLVDSSLSFRLSIPPRFIHPTLLALSPTGSHDSQRHPR